MGHRKDMRLPASVRGKTTGKQKRQNRPPEDMPWVWVTREILESDAHRSLSGNALHTLDRIILDHMAHGGTENGNLLATYDQIAAHGVRRQSIAKAIRELVFFGFIRIKKGHAFKGEHTPSIYRLTWLPLPDGAPATNEWKAITAEHVKAWKTENRQRNKAVKEYRQKKQNNAGNVVSFAKIGGDRDG